MDNIIEHYLAIGKKVTKRGKPFKSGRKENTVRGIVLHPKKKVPAFIFKEDDSVMECEKCTVIDNEGEPIRTIADGFRLSRASPENSDMYRSFSLEVKPRGKGTWAIVHFNSVLSRKGKWDYEPLPSSRTAAWLKNHRFGLQEAMELARKHLDDIEVNGHTLKSWKEHLKSIETKSPEHR